MSCFYCGDKVKTWRCRECRADVGAACPECHAEKSHGVIAPATPTRGSRADAAVTRRMKDDPSPWDENNTRAMEDTR